MAELGLPYAYDSQTRGEVSHDIASRLSVHLAERGGHAAKANQAVLAIIGGSLDRDPAAEDSLQKAQVLLRPMLSSIASKVDLKGGRNALLLPLGPPKTTQEYVSPLFLAKPSARFVQISLA